MGHPAGEVNIGGLNVMYTLLNVNYQEQTETSSGFGVQASGSAWDPSEFAGQEPSTTKLTKGTKKF
jgi:hypothetical protein